MLRKVLRPWPKKFGEIVEPGDYVIVYSDFDDTAFLEVHPKKEAEILKEFKKVVGWMVVSDMGDIVSETDKCVYCTNMHDQSMIVVCQK